MRTPKAALISACLTLLLSLAMAHPALAKRVALVIGNSNYENTVALPNPVRDAKGVAAALNRLGFEVILGLDTDFTELRANIRDFSSRIEGAKVALFYYAGHGLQVDGRNYLAPVNAKLSQESDLDFEALPLNFILRQMEREQRTNLVFLDACRDNPLANKLARSLKGRSTSISRGLARVESGIGMLIGYATSPGMVALDGQGENSPYTKALLKHIETPGVSINDMMIAVRQDVLAESDGKQIPWEHSSLTGQFYFKPPKVAEAAQAKQETSSIEPRPPSSAESQLAMVNAYQAAALVGTCGSYRAFKEKHEGSFYAKLADEYLTKNCSGPKRAIGVESSQQEQTAPPPAEKETAVAAADPAASQATSEAPQPDPGVLTTEMQKELDRLGCDPGRADGLWGGRTVRALSEFNRHAKLDLSTDGPTAEALDALKAKKGRICPEPVHAAPVQRRAPAHAGSRAPRRVERAPREPKKDRYWGGEATRLECERGALSLDCFEQR